MKIIFFSRGGRSKREKDYKTRIFRSKKEAPLGWKEALMSIGEFADYMYK